MTAAAAPYGLVGLAGSSHDVGVVGYTLGGGMSWLARSHGLAVNSVLAIDVVTADGVLRRVDHEHEPELFWALRGGSGDLGVVTAVLLELYPVSEVVAGAMFFPLERMREVFTVWSTWSRDLPESVTSSLRALRVPPLPDVPEVFAGQAFAVVDGAVLDDAERAAQLLQPLRDLGPVVDMWAPMPASKLAEIHMDPPGPVPGCGDGTVVEDLPHALVDRFVDLVGPDATDCALLSLELRMLGGAAGRSQAKGGAIDSLPGRFAVYAVGIAATPEMGAAASAQAAAVVAATEPWRAEREYLGFAEQRRPGGCFHDEATLARLRAVRDSYDPRGVLRSTQDLFG